MKKLLAMLVVVILVLTPFGIISAFANDSDSYIGTELIVDGGFDKPLGEAWNTTWSVGIVKADSSYAGGKAGDNCLEIQNWTPGVNQEVTLKGGYIYRLTFLYSSGYTSGNANAIKVSFGDLIPEESYESTNYNYITVTYEFLCKEDKTAKLSFGADGNSRPQHIDDVSLVATEKLDPNAYVGRELIVDGEFNKPLGEAWTKAGWDSTKIVSADSSYASGRAGDNCVEIPNWQPGISQTVSLLGGYSYKLTFLYASSYTSGNPNKIKVSFGDLIPTQNYQSTNFNYITVIYEFDLEADTTATLSFGADGNSSPQHIDNVSLVPVKSLNEEPDREQIGIEVVKDGGFDEEMGTNWKIVWGPDSTIEKAQESFAGAMDKTGDNCLKIPNWSGGVSQSVTLKGGYRYALTFLYAPCSEIGADVGMRVTLGSLLDEQVIYNDKGYIQVTYSFKCKEDTTANLWFRRDSHSSAKPPYIDDISLMAVNALADEPNITIDSSKGGTVELDKTRARAGDTVTLKIKEILDNFALAEGYPTYLLNGTSVPLTKVSDTEYTFIMPQGETTVEVRFTAGIGTELLPDFGFEAGEISENAESGWKLKSKQTKIVNESPYEGKYCLSVNSKTSSAIETDVFIEKGATYLLSFIHLGANEGKQHNTGVFLLDGENNLIDPVLTTNDDDWNRYAKVFTADKTGNITVAVKNVSSDQKAYFDNISLKKVEQSNTDPDAWSGNYNPSKDLAPDTTNLIKDSSFEERNIADDAEKGWTPTKNDSQNKISFVKYDWLVNSGKSSMRVAAATNFGASQKVTVEPHTNYELSFWCTADTDGAGILIGSSLENSYDIYTFAKVKQAEGMVKYSFAFKTEAITELYVTLSNPSGYAVYFDDVVLKELDNRIIGDLGFRKNAEISSSDITDSSFTVQWSAVKSKLNHNEDLTYYVYCTDKEITEAHIASLTPKAEIKGDLPRKATIAGLDDYVSYNIVIMATDKLGNKAYLYGDPVKTNITASTEVKNGGFETGDLRYWYSLSPQRIGMSKITADGKWSAQMNDWCYLFYQPVIAEPDAEYVYSYDIFQSSGMVKFYVFNNGNHAFDTCIKKDDIAPSTEFKKYTGTITTKSDTRNVWVSFYNGEDYNFVTVDNVYFKKIENKDLYFFNEPQNFLATENAIIVNWLQVHSADKPENITYEVFMSEKPITKENIGLLSPIYVNEGADSTMALAEGLERGKGYYFAVRAKDSLGNVVEEFTSAPLYTVETVEEKEEETKEEITDTEQEDTEIPDSDTTTDNTDSESEDIKDIFDSYLDEDLSFVEDEEITDIPDTNTDKAPEQVKKTATKILTSTTVTPLWARRIIGVALIVLGCVFVAFPIMILFRKKRRKGV